MASAMSASTIAESFVAECSGCPNPTPVTDPTDAPGFIVSKTISLFERHQSEKTLNLIQEVSASEIRLGPTNLVRVCHKPPYKAPANITTCLFRQKRFDPRCRLVGTRHHEQVPVVDDLKPGIGDEICQYTLIGERNDGNVDVSLHQHY